jgi:hypothetical protein
LFDPAQDSVSAYLWVISQEHFHHFSRFARDKAMYIQSGNVFLLKRMLKKGATAVSQFIYTTGVLNNQEVFSREMICFIVYYFP